MVTAAIQSNHFVLHMGRYGVLAIARRHPRLFAKLMSRIERA